MCTLTRGRPLIILEGRGAKRKKLLGASAENNRFLNLKNNKLIGDLPKKKFDRENPDHAPPPYD